MEWLPYDDELAKAGMIISTVVASVLTFSLVYVVGLALHHLTLSRAAFEELSRRDMLSGLMNRRAFLDEVTRAPAASSLIMFDIDKFKAINDRFGHDIGDQAIIAVSRQLEEIFSQSHAVARIGGEEFAVLVSALSPTERLALAHRCTQLIAARPIQAGQTQVDITVSGGVADQEDFPTFDALYKACDKALFVAKASGRNCVVHSRDIAVIVDGHQTATM
jgi:diguanylate cyclase (GGDEF)-like protein